MDLLDYVAGVRLYGACELLASEQRKKSALRHAWSRTPLECRPETFGEYLEKIPLRLLQTCFGPPSLDAHYTSILAPVLLCRPDCDIVLISILNYLLQVATYQGRYLGSSWPDAFVFASGDPVTAAGALANVDRIQSFSLEPRIDQEVLDALAPVCVNIGAPQVVDVTSLPTVIPAPPNRYIGCVAFTGLVASSADLSQVAGVAAACAASHRLDTHYLFAGECAPVLELAEALRAHGGREIIKAYTSDVGGARSSRAILIISELERPPELPMHKLHTTQRYTFAHHDDVVAGRVAGVVEREVCKPEVVVQKPARFVSSGAPIKDVQLSTISSTLTLTHTVQDIDHGVFINAQASAGSAAFVIASRDRSILVHANDPSSLSQSAFAWRGAPEIEVPRLRQVFVEGPCLPLAFAPTLLDYHSHFLLQCLPRIRVAEELGVADFKLLSCTNLKRYQREMLSRAGVPNERIILLQPDCEYHCERLIVPNIQPAILSKFQAGVYDRFQTNAPPERTDLPKRILISRAARSTWRNMVNYDLVAQLLVDELDFVIVAPDKMSLQDEIELFAGAEIVVGAEGAGLYNCVFMRPGAEVVCLADEDYVMYVLGAMANYRGFDVSFVFGESFQADKDWLRRAGHADFVLDPARVLTCVRRVIAAKQARGA